MSAGAGLLVGAVIGSVISLFIIAWILRGLERRVQGLERRVRALENGPLPASLLREIRCAVAEVMPGRRG